MNKQSITPEQFRAVAGTMPAGRAADALGISQANFYRLAQSYSISTAFVYKPWKPEGYPDNRIHECPPSDERANIRSATPLGFARAVFLSNAPHLNKKREAA